MDQAGEAARSQKGTRSGVRVELAMLHSKIKHCQLNLYPFHAAFSGITSGWQLVHDSVFSISISQIFIAPHFEWANKVSVM